MSHSFNKIWIHAIWATKDRLPLIHPMIEIKFHQFIAEQLREQGCPVRIINGMPDHIHCLFLLSPQKSIAEVIKQIKGSSSHFMNQNHLIAEKFAWQTGYAAYSVSESVVDKVFQYIKNQKQHHTKKTFQQEYDEFVKLYGLDNEKEFGVSTLRFDGGGDKNY
jgi:putative transposase